MKWHRKCTLANISNRIDRSVYIFLHAKCPTVRVKYYLSVETINNDINATDCKFTAQNNRQFYLTPDLCIETNHITIHFTLKFHKMLFVHNIHFSCQTFSVSSRQWSGRNLEIDKCKYVSGMQQPPIDYCLTNTRLRFRLAFLPEKIHLIIYHNNHHSEDPHRLGCFE